jgi:hypothetical protein
MRHYFYEIDLFGRLFLADTKVKNFATCFKDALFLNFFFSRIVKRTCPTQSDYRYCSICGPEFNWIKTQDSPIVFHSLSDNKLVYAASKQIAFNPSLVSVHNGRFYHPIPFDLGWTDKRVGLITSTVIQEMVLNLDTIEYEGYKYKVHQW